MKKYIIIGMLLLILPFTYSKVDLSTRYCEWGGECVLDNLTINNMAVINQSDLNITNCINFTDGSYLCGDDNNLNYLTVDYINASYIYSIHSDTAADIRGDPWYFWTSLETSDDIIVGDEITLDGDSISSWDEFYNHKYGASDWLYNDSNTIYFNESKLEVIYYNATQANAVAGTITGGNITSTQHQDANYDGITLNITEQAGSPGLEIYMNFTGVEQFQQGIMRYKTSTLAGDHPVIQVWDYNESEWEDYPTMSETETFAIITEPVFDWQSHLKNGIVQMRIYKASNGNTQNKYYIDWVALSKSFGVPSGMEVDPYSIHKDAINETQFYYNTKLNLNISYFDYFSYMNIVNLNVSLLNVTSINLNGDIITSWTDFNVTYNDTKLNASNPYLYNDSQSLFFNETMLNHTIGQRDTNLSNGGTVYGNLDVTGNVTVMDIMNVSRENGTLYMGVHKIVWNLTEWCIGCP